MTNQTDDIIEVPDNSSETAVVTTEAPAENRAMIVLEMETMIKNHLTSIDNYQEELDKHKSLLDAIFDNDPTYKDHTEKAKEASRIKSATKQQILKQPQAAELNDKIKTLKSEVSELQGALSDYLREYQRLSGMNEIEDDAGEVREIVYTAKLVKKSFKF